jgi:hypothetical protein
MSVAAKLFRKASKDAGVVDSAGIIINPAGGDIPLIKVHKPG